MKPEQIVNWRKSSRSVNTDKCVEVGRVLDGSAAVRDTKDRAAGYLTTSPGQWLRFITALKSGRYDG